MHKSGKQFYRRTNKKNAISQIARLEERQRILQSDVPNPKPSKRIVQKDSQPSDSNSELSYEISNNKKHPINVYKLIIDNKDDPALQEFLPKLRKFMLSKLNRGDQAGHIQFVNNRLYQHWVLKINYTTYDLQSKSDTVNPNTHHDIMILRNCASNNVHPYEYARVIGIFHADVSYLGSPLEIKPVHFLWIRRFESLPGVGGPFTTHRLLKLRFLDSRHPKAFDFIDPEQVTRGIHIIPSFADGKSEGGEEWRMYCTGLFAERDLFMRFRGGGIGHKTTRQFDEFLLSDGTGQTNDEPQDEEEVIDIDEEEANSPTSDIDRSSDNESSSGDESGCIDGTEEDAETDLDSDTTSDDDDAEEGGYDDLLGFGEL